MLDRIAHWAAALDLTGVVALPVWAVAAALTVAVVVAVLALLRTGADGRSLPAAFLVLVAIAGACWWVGDYLAGRDRAADERALNARIFELATRAFMPGSALGCLDPIVDETMEAACEKAIFASPEAAAAAMSYVAAQLAVLASAREVGNHAAEPGILALRRALEADRFGLVAHVLAARDGCTADECSAFAWLGDTSRIKVHLAERPFESRLKTYSGSWPSAGSRAVATSAPPPSTPGPAARVPNNLYFPSASSIPPVNIMTAEPPGAQRQPQDTTGAAATAPPTPPRRPPQAAAPPRQSPSAAPAPMPVNPAQ
ncbi:MAG TPA: hypothetical protein VE667_12620 [Xanthobacteraceae bacterium]|nr:hypothetical protein [Xanthobacteraceae bacterium]